MSDFERKTEINKRAQARYDELMRQGKHGHYETMFRVIHEERAAAIAECERIADIPASDSRADVAGTARYIRDAIRALAPTALPKPTWVLGRQPCGECHLQPGETCNICGAKVSNYDDLASPPAPQEDETPHIPPIITCPKCGATAMAFVCSERGCPVNGGAAYE